MAGWATTSSLPAGAASAGGTLAGLFTGFVESLTASATPTTAQDVAVITDFDPREDVLVLPLQSAVASSLSYSIVAASQVPGGSGDIPVLEISAGGKTYAYLELSSDFVSDMGPLPTIALDELLANLFNFRSELQEQNGTVGFTNLVSASISSQLADGGFRPVAATLPSGSTVALFGAIGGMAISNQGEGTPYGTILAGTNYSDALAATQGLLAPDKIPNMLALPTYIHGFGGDDLIYGSASNDTLFGDDGNDVLYSFTTTGNGLGSLDPESLSGGAGDDVLYGGASAGTFDGGSGTDTFAVQYLSFTPPMQVEIDLVAGYAAERTAPADKAAPASDTAPFPGTGPDKVLNSYTLVGFENATGGPLNDWLRGTAGSVLEGGPGADYLDAKAGGITLTYGTSAEAVTVHVRSNGVYSTSGGDAEGDVIAYSDLSQIKQLIGSANNDTLGAVTIYPSQPDENLGSGFIMTGGGGSDTFQLLGVATDTLTGLYTITDFTESAIEHDIIDLRPLGVPSYQWAPAPGGVLVAGTLSIVKIELPGFTGKLSSDDFIFAAASHGDAYVVQQGNALNYAASKGVLLNDDDATSASLASGPGHGTLILASDGGFSYTPDPGFTGIDTFTYRASDGVNLVDAGVAIHVVPVSQGATATLDLLHLTADQQIAATYAGLLGRAADASGFAFWRAQYDTSLPSQGPAKLLDNIVNAFAASTEAKALYPLLAQPQAASDGQIAAFLDSVYANLFDRAVDAGGKTYWSSLINQALQSSQGVGHIVVDILGGAQDTAAGQDITTVIGKVAVSLAFVGEQQAHGTVWAGASDNAAATSLLQAVTADPESVLTGIKTAEALIAAHP